jgi:integrase
VLTGDEARALFEAIDHKTDDDGRRVEKQAHEMTVAELRDRALIGVMVYSFARVGAVLGMDVGDYYQQGKRWRIRLHEKGGKEHQVPCHHRLGGRVPGQGVQVALDDDGGRRFVHGWGT